MTNGSMPSERIFGFSLLHATYRAGDVALETRSVWLDRASESARIEHIFAMDEDDELSVRITANHRRVISPAWPGRVTAVRNWNAAAASSRGRILVAIADDLLPPDNWDAALLEVIGDLDPLISPFVIKIGDSRSEESVLVRHPIVSFGHFDQFGFMPPSYTGVFVDNEFTLRTLQRALVLDGRNLAFTHVRQDTESQQAVNAVAEYDVGRSYWESRWSPQRRWYLQRRYSLVQPIQASRVSDRSIAFQIGMKRALASIVIPLHIPRLWVHRSADLLQRLRSTRDPAGASSDD